MLCLLTALHCGWENSHFSWPNAEDCLDCRNSYLLLFLPLTWRGTKPVWWLVWRDLVFRRFSSASPSLGTALRGDPEHQEEQSSPELMLSGQPKAISNTEPTGKGICKQFGLLHLKCLPGFCFRHPNLISDLLLNFFYVWKQNAMFKWNPLSGLR